jgi:hypothetical protein
MCMIHICICQILEPYPIFLCMSLCSTCQTPQTMLVLILLWNLNVKLVDFIFLFLNNLQDIIYNTIITTKQNVFRVTFEDMYYFSHYL